MQAADLTPFSEHRMALVNVWAVGICTVLFLTVAIGSCASRSCCSALYHPSIALVSPFLMTTRAPEQSRCVGLQVRSVWRCGAG